MHYVHSVCARAFARRANFHFKTMSWSRGFPCEPAALAGRGSWGESGLLCLNYLDICFIGVIL